MKGNTYAQNLLVLITARGGSKGIKNKNIKNFYGKPLISWTIRAAKKTFPSATVIVSTDSKQIAEVSKQYGAFVPFLRPVSLAQDNTPTFPVFIHAFDWCETNLKQAFDYVMLLQPTTPLRSGELLSQAFKKIVQNDGDSLTTTNELGPFCWKNKLIPLYNKATRPRRQDFNNTNTFSFEDGSVFLFNPTKARIEGTLLPGETIIIESEPYRSIDIDTELDWIVAEKLAPIFLNSDEDIIL